MEHGKTLQSRFFNFFPNAQLFMHCFSLSFLIYVTVFIIFILFSAARRVGGVGGHAPSTLIAEITRVFPYIFVFFPNPYHAIHIIFVCVVPKTRIPWLKSLRQ